MFKLFATENRWAPLLARLFLGGVMFPHGAQKLFGWFGGEGMAGTLAMFTGKMHLPLVLALLVIAAEGVGSILLLCGFLTRLAALGIVCNMTGAILLVHRQNGFFMNWFGSQAGEGFEYHLLAIALGLVLMIEGGGRWSIDRLVAKHFDRRR